MESTENAFGIRINEQVITNEQIIADHFNKFFINIASDLKQPLKPSHFEKLNNFIHSKVTDDVSFDIRLINCTFVSSFLSSMDGTKLTGLDCIGPWLLKIDSTVLSPSITFIINKALILVFFRQFGNMLK